MLRKFVGALVLVVLMVGFLVAAEYKGKVKSVDTDKNTITVTVGGNTVEVCCEACAQSLREAHASTLGQED